MKTCGEDPEAYFRVVLIGIGLAVLLIGVI